MRTLRYRTWRHVFAAGVVGWILSFLSPVCFGPEGIGRVLQVAGWLIAGTSVLVAVGVDVLRKLGVLEFSYTEKDFSSYLYNADKCYQQMRNFRRAKKRE